MSGVSTLTGTTNQVVVSSSTGNVTLSLPQDIATSSTPQFARLGIGAAADGTYHLKLNGALLYGLDTSIGHGTSTPETTLGVTNFTSSDTVNHIVSSGIASFTGEGASSGTFNLIHTGAATDKKWFQFISSGGKGSIRGINDAVNAITFTFLTCDLGNGRVGINNTSPGYQLAVSGTVQLANLTTSTGAQSAAMCLNASNEVISDTFAGCVVSAKRFKKNIKSLDFALDTVMQLRPVSFKYKKTGNKELDKRGIHIGFIADEALRVEPRLVGLNSKSQPVSFDYQGYTAILTRAIQEQQAQIEILESRIESLREQIYA